MCTKSRGMIHHTMPNRSTNITPFYLLFGTHIKIRENGDSTVNRRRMDHFVLGAGQEKRSLKCIGRKKNLSDINKEIWLQFNGHDILDQILIFNIEFNNQPIAILCRFFFSSLHNTFMFKFKLSASISRCASSSI